MHARTEPAAAAASGGSLRLWAGRVLDIGLLLLVVAALLFARSEDPDKTIFGYRIYMVLSGSMEPDIPQGSMVAVQEVPPSSLQVGDDITFHTGDADHEVITHRIVEIVPDYEGTGSPGYITQGVARSVPDEEIRPAASVLGRVTLCIPLLGYLLSFFQSDYFLIPFLVLIAGAAVLLLWKIWRPER